MEAKTENKLRYSTTVTTVKPYITALYMCITLCITLAEQLPKNRPLDLLYTVYNLRAHPLDFTLALVRSTSQKSRHCLVLYPFSSPDSI